MERAAAEQPVCVVPFAWSRSSRFDRGWTGFGAFGFVFSPRSGFLRYSVGALRGAHSDSPEGRAETTSLRDEAAWIGRFLADIV